MPARRRLACPREGCTKSYLNAGDRDDHVSWEHDHVARHMCGECQQSFPSKSNLRRHQENVHVKQRSLCTFCMAEADMRPDNFKRQHKGVCTNPPADGDWKGAIKPIKPVATEVVPEVGLEVHLDQDQMILDLLSFEPQLEAFTPAEAVVPTEQQASELLALPKCMLFEQIINICNANGEPGLVNADDFVAVQDAMRGVIDIPRMGGWTYLDLYQFAITMDLN